MHFQKDKLCLKKCRDGQPGWWKDSKLYIRDKVEENGNPFTGRTQNTWWTNRNVQEENVSSLGNSSSWQARLVVFENIRWNCSNSDVIQQRDGTSSVPELSMFGTACYKLLCPAHGGIKRWCCLTSVCLTSDVCRVHQVGGRRVRPAGCMERNGWSGPARPAWLKAAAACFRCRPRRGHIVAAAHLQLVIEAPSVNAFKKWLDKYW